MKKSIFYSSYVPLAYRNPYRPPPQFSLRDPWNLDPPPVLPHHMLPNIPILQLAKSFYYFETQRKIRRKSADFYHFLVFFSLGSWVFMALCSLVLSRFLRNFSKKKNRNKNKNLFQNDQISKMEVECGLKNAVEKYFINFQLIFKQFYFFLIFKNFSQKLKKIMNYRLRN